MPSFVGGSIVEMNVHSNHLNYKIQRRICKFKQLKSNKVHFCISKLLYKVIIESQLNYVIVIMKVSK